MSRTPTVPDLPELPVGSTLEQVVAWLQPLRTQNLAREPVSVGDPLQKFVTRGELVGFNLLSLSKDKVVGAGTAAGGVAGGGTGGAGGSTAPDLTPPTSISGLSVVASLTNFFVEFDAPTYAQGHGNGYTAIYAANWAGTPAPLPTFSDAVEIYQVTGAATIAVIPAQIDTTTCFWAGAVSVDGVRQVDGAGPTGGTHGVSGTTGLIGGADLGPLIIQAANLASGAVTGPKLAADSIAVGTAAVENGAIINAMIGNAEIDNAKIADVSAGKLTAGSIAVGEYIHSTGFLPGSAGWAINGNGTAEFSAAVIRDRLIASQIDGRGLAIEDSSGGVILAAGNPLSPANMTGVISTSNKLSAVNASSYLANAAIDSAYINNLRTANYAEDTGGNPTAGAKLASAGTALKVANSAIQIGTAIFTDYWARLVQGIDGTGTTAILWRGNNDASSRGGAPNIACLTVTTQCDQVLNSNFQTTYLTYKLTPTSYTSYSDNLDAMQQMHVQFYGSASDSVPFTETYQPCPSRCYDGATGAVSGCLQWGWRFSGPGAVTGTSVQHETNGAYDAYLRVRLANTYGFSASKDLYGGGGSAAVGRMMTTSSITGSTGSTGGGSGGQGGACPAPWVMVRLINGREVAAGDLHNGAVLAAVDDNTFEARPAGGVVADLQRRWAMRYRLTFTNGNAVEFSENHRLACIGSDGTPSWVPVQKIRPGTHVMGLEESIVQTNLAAGEGQVVSFLVKGAGTYFAGGLLCHNAKVLP